MKTFKNHQVNLLKKNDLMCLNKTWYRYICFGVLIIIGNIHTLSAQNNSWFTKIEGAGNTYPSTITTDKDDNVLSSGSFTSDVYVYNDSFKLINTQTRAAYIIKLTKTGKFLWSKKFESNISCGLSKITTDDSGNIYTGGSFQSKLYFDNDSIISSNINPASNSDAFIICFDKLGNKKWVKTFYSSLLTSLYTINFNQNELYFTTIFRDSTITFNGHIFKGISYKSGNFVSNCLLCKINTKGDIIWGKVFSSENRCYIQTLNFDKDNNLYIGGTMSYKFLDIDGKRYIPNDTTGSIFFAKLARNGDMKWIKFANTDNKNNIGRVKNLIFDENSNIYAGGSFINYFKFQTLDFKVKIQPTTYDYDIFIIKMDSSGNVIWGKSYGTNKKDAFDMLSGLVYQEGIYFTADYFNTSIDLDTFHLKTIATGGITYIAKMDKNGNILKIFQPKVINIYNQASSGALTNNKNGQIYLTGTFNNGVSFDTLTPVSKDGVSTKN